MDNIVKERKKVERTDQVDSHGKGQIFTLTNERTWLATRHTLSNRGHSISL